MEKFIWLRIHFSSAFLVGICGDREFEVTLQRWVSNGEGMGSTDSCQSDTFT